MSTNSPHDDLDDLLGTHPRRTTAELDEIFLPLEQSPQTTAVAYRPPQETQLSGSESSPIGPLSYTIAVPQSTKWDAKLAHSLVEKILTGKEDIVFQIVSEHRAIRWQIIDVGEQNPDPTHLIAIIRSVFPEVAVQVEPYREPAFAHPFTRLTVPFAQIEPYYAPIRYADDLKNHDPLVTLVNLLNLAEEGERIAYLVYVIRHAPKASQEGWKQITRSNASVGNVINTALSAPRMLGDRGYGAIIMGGIQAYFEYIKHFRAKAKPELRPPKFETELHNLFVGKINDLLYETCLFIQCDVTNPARLDAFHPIYHTLYEFKTDHQVIGAGEKVDQTTVKITNPQDAANRSVVSFVTQIAREGRPPKGWRYTSIFNPREIASLWHLPNERFAASKIAWPKKHIPIPDTLLGQRDGVQIGANFHQGGEKPVFMRRAARVSHAYLVGRTGFGKSNFLHHLIHQDIAEGYGVCVIDPHGTLISDVLRYSIPAGREDDVVVLDIHTESHPIPLNLLSVPQDIDREARVAQIDAVFKRYGHFEDTRTLAPTLWNSLLLLQSEPKPILRDIPKLLNNSSYRSQLRERAERNLAFEDFWNGFEEKSDAQKEITTVPLIQRVSEFYSSIPLALMTCHPDSLDFRRLILENKIILFSLYDPASKWKEEHKQLLGGVVVSQVTMGAWARGAHGKPFYLYIDEVENFVSAPLPKILEQARKYSLSLTLASQHLSQLKGDVLKSVIGTIGAFGVFQVGYDDARELVHYLPGFDVHDLTNMDKHHAAFRMQHGEATYAFSIKTLDPLDRGQKGDAAPVGAFQREMLIRERSIANYTPKTREEVLRWLDERDKKAEPKPKKTASRKKGTNPDEFLSAKPQGEGIDE